MWYNYCFRDNGEEDYQASRTPRRHDARTHNAQAHIPYHDPGKEKKRRLAASHRRGVVRETTERATSNGQRVTDGGMDESKDSIRLHEIEMELDKTDPRESPPYRGARAKLNREKAAIFRRIEGRDPMCAVLGRQSDGDSKYNDLSEEQKVQYRMRRKVLHILGLLEKLTGPKWWEIWK